ncbi:MAG: hypothetical protein R3A47_01830 [Polyangiales bacterium]
MKPVELYRVDDDPREQHDVAESDANLVKRGITLLESQKQAAKQGASTAGDVELDDDVAKRLKALGYRRKRNISVSIDANEADGVEVIADSGQIVCWSRPRFE